MSNVLLSDPLLTWLNPKDLLHLSQVNKEYGKRIKEYQQTKTTYDTQCIEQEPHIVRKQLYALYPKVQTLVFHQSHIEFIEEYLRPSLQALHLVFTLHLAYPGPSEDDTFEWVNSKSFKSTLQRIRFCLSTSDCQLQEIRISFHPEIFLSVTIEDGIQDGYDKFGPLYEDYEKHICLHLQDASYVLPFIDDFYVMEIQREIQRLERVQLWKTFDVPLYFTHPQKMNKELLEEVKELLECAFV
jgi:hypothetical protein